MEDNAICYFGETDARNKRVKFGIKGRDRSRHTYVIGKTGMGKSTMLENMAIQDMRRGDGMAFIDPHGKTAELLLDYVPEERIKDVLYFAPFDLEYPVSFNVMEDVGPDKRHLVVSGLMSAFKKIWVDAWSARMEYILSNILLALLEYPDATILGVNRMLADKDYRKKVVDNVQDVSVRSFWVDEFAKYGDRYMQEAGAAIQNKVGQFVSNPLIRNIIGQPKSTFDLRKMMDQKKIIIVNLSKGRVGEQNANLLGSMFITKLYLAAMSRADLTEAALSRLPNFYLYVDEFQSFANESFANILSEARKYKLALTIAHQYIEQMSEEVRAAVFGNVGTMVIFRVGAYDAEVLEKEFAPKFTAEDIVNLGIFQVYLKLMIDGVSSPPFSATTMAPLERPLVSFRDDTIEYTRRTYARVRSDVEEVIKEWSHSQKPEEPARRPRSPEQADTFPHPVKAAPVSQSVSVLKPPVHHSEHAAAPVLVHPSQHKTVARVPTAHSVPEVKPVTQAPLSTPVAVQTPVKVPATPMTAVVHQKPIVSEITEGRAPVPPHVAEVPPRHVYEQRHTPATPYQHDKKAGTPEHKSDLRNALASILKDVKEKEERAAETIKSQASPVSAHHVPPRVEQKQIPPVHRTQHGTLPAVSHHSGQVSAETIEQVLHVPPPQKK